MTDNKQAHENTQKSAEQLKAEALKSVLKQQAENKSVKSEPLKNNKLSSEKNAQKISKIAVFSLFVALLTSAAVAALYYWQSQQRSQFEQNFIQKNQQVIAKQQRYVQELLTKQQKQLKLQVEQTLTSVVSVQQNKIAQVESTITRLTQRQPSDWLLHESEYLLRVAVRSMWLEKNTDAAIGLLKDADQRLKTLNQPQFLPVRQLINQDIEQLQLLPKLSTDETILALMGLAQQVKNLPLTKIERLDSAAEQQAFQLSASATDWRENLTRSWHKFIGDFITIRRRSAAAEPLMSPQYQQNLRENLSLKLQLAQWAVSQAKEKIFQSTLDDIQQWHLHYFDMTNPINQNFTKRITALKQQIIAVNMPKTLSSLVEIQNIIAEQSFTKPVAKIVEQKQVKPTTKLKADGQIQELTPIKKAMNSQKKAEQPKLLPKSEAL